jgi:hypothetical protein
MKFFKAACIIFIAVIMAASCKQSPKEITPELFLEIENKILSTDLTPSAKEEILDKYGLTLKDYTDYEEKIESDPEVKAKMGEIRLKSNR